MRRIRWNALVPAVAAAALWLSPVGLVAAQAPGPSTATKPPIKREIGQLLYARNFARLDAMLAGLHLDFERDVSRESVVHNAFEAFALSDDAVESLLREWVKTSPTSFAAQLALGSYHYHRGFEARGGGVSRDTRREQFRGMEEHFAKSASALEAALKLNAQLMPAYGYLISMGRTMTSRPDDHWFKSALVVCESCLGVRRIYITGITPRWGGSYQRMERFAKEAQAFATVNPSLKVLPGYVAWDRPELLRFDKKYVLAVKEYTAALAFGAHCPFLYDRAVSLYNLKRYAEAGADLDQCLRQPRDSHFERAGAMERVYALRGNVEYHLGDVEGAATHFKAARDYSLRTAEVTDLVSDVTHVLLNEGATLYKEKKFQLAVDRYRVAVRLDPRLATAWQWQANALVQLGRLDEALPVVRQAIQLDPRNMDNLKLADWILAKRGDWPAVIDLWTKVINRDPQNAQAYLERGGAHLHSGNRAAALQDAERACQLGNAEACSRAQQVRPKK